ncbi:MAG: hypothetical protein JO047_02730 [Alphaproteobacteria bacterium]|nr:hypothetical protein [Alphaproteobacteria bacterium]
MNRRILAVVVLAAMPALASAQDQPAPGPGHETRQQVGDAARQAGQVLRRGWERTKQAARQASDAMDQGWHTIEHGVRWGWNHPHGDADQPPR